MQDADNDNQPWAELDRQKMLAAIEIVAHKFIGREIKTAQWHEEQLEGGGYNE